MQINYSRIRFAHRRCFCLLGLLLGLLIFAAACSDDAASPGGWDLEDDLFEGADADASSDTRNENNPPDIRYPDSGLEDVDTREEPGARPIHCLRVNPIDTLNFGMSTVGVATYKTVVIENCSPNAPLNLQDIAFSMNESDVFNMDDDPLFNALRQGERVLRAGEQAHFTVTFLPFERVSYRGSIRILSDDPSQGMIELALIGAGTPNRCPSAIAVGKRQGDTFGEPSKTVEAAPLDTILFDGSESRDIDGHITRYEWTLISSPTASSARLVPADGRTSSLYLDASGEYQVLLTTYDNEDTMSCGQQAIVTVIATSGADIHIQLTWAAEVGFADHDVDLHYRHPNAQRWASSSNGWDCYYGNRTPDWQVPDGSPILDIDDLTGPGPENISHSNLENVSYDVGIEYYSDHGNGPAYATVEIRHNGMLIYEERDRYLTHKQFWQVGVIDGGTHTFTRTGILTPGYPQ